MTGTIAPAPVRIDMLRAAVAARPHSAELIYQLAEAFAEIGDNDHFADCFRRAFRLAPMVRPRLEADAAGPLNVRAGRLAQRARALIARGVMPAPVISTLATAAALLGDRAEVSRLIDYDRFFRCIDLAPSDQPAPADLIAELEHGLKRVEKGAGKAGDGEYRFAVFDTDTPACTALAQEIRRQVDSYIAALPTQGDHPFVASRPQAYTLEAWVVFSRGDDHFNAHIHPQAWLSGVYYIQQPSMTEGGRLHICPPTQFGVSVADGWEERHIEPAPGRLVLMPGYFYHATTATLSAQARICVAFNVVPTDLA